MKEPSEIPTVNAHGPTPRMIVLLAWTAILCGCASDGTVASSRWAMDDPKYASQYGNHTNPHRIRKLTRTIEQMTDARFQNEKGGLYVSAGISPGAKDPLAAGGEIGIFGLPTSWSTLRIGAVGLLASGLPNYLTGAVIGGRFYLPTRLSPYLGISGMGGVTADTNTTVTSSYVDSNGNWVYAGERVPEKPSGMGAIIPEAGLSFWLNTHWRLNMGASYYVNTLGRDHDFALYGISMDFIAKTSSADDEPPQTASPELESIIQEQEYFLKSVETLPTVPFPVDSPKAAVENPNSDNPDPVVDNPLPAPSPIGNGLLPD